LRLKLGKETLFELPDLRLHFSSGVVARRNLTGNFDPSGLVSQRQPGTTFAERP